MAFVPKSSNPTVWAYIRSVLQWSIGLPILVFHLLIILITSLFVSPMKLDPLLRVFSRHMVWIAGITIRAHGLENIEPHKPYIFIFNHTNIFDHFVIYLVLNRCIRGVEKEDHFRWPLYGLFLRRVGQIPIAPRGDTTRAIAALDKARKLFELGISLGIAPEGTRTSNGELGPFKKGAFHVAVGTQATIVPMILSGMFQFNKKGDWLIYPRPIDVYIEKPIPTTDPKNTDISELTQRVRKIFVNRLESSNTATT